MAAAVAEKLKAKSPENAPNYGATTTLTIARAFDDDAALYDQAALDAAVATERERCARIVEQINGWIGTREVAAEIRGETQILKT